MELPPDPLAAPLPMPPIPTAALTQLEYESAQFAPGKGGLIAMSVIFFGIGALTGCGVLAIPFMLMRTGLAPGPGASQLAMAVVMYGAIAVAAVWTGVGCCRARRWVRPVVLAGAWPALLMGCVMLIAMIITVLPTMAGLRGNTSGAGMPTLLIMAMFIIPALMAVVFFVGIPATLVWFFQRRQTAQTLWFYDPVPGWTDRCPIPVLAWSLWNGLGALVGSLSLLTNGTVPVFGFLITGATAAGIIVLVAAIILCAAVGSYLLKPWAWWLSPALSVVWAASWLTLLLRGRLPEYVAQTTPTNTPSAQELHMASNPWFLSLTVLGMLLGIGFVVYLRRYFVRSQESSSVPATSRS